MKRLGLLFGFSSLALVLSFAQDSTTLLITAPSPTQLQLSEESAGNNDGSAPKRGIAASDPAADSVTPALASRCVAGNKFGYYLAETYFNASLFTAPAFRAGIRMANPPGKGATRYPLEWRQGAEAFGRNYGDAFAQRISFHTARFATGLLTHEDPRYIPSGSRNLFARSVHAFAFTLVDRSDAGHAMPAFSSFVGAAAAGFVGNAYLPTGFNDVTHAGQRATLQFGFAAAGNLFREFAPQMPRPVRTFVELIAR